MSNALSTGADINDKQLVALAQAKIQYCKYVANIIRDYEVRAFAIISSNNPRYKPEDKRLRRDYTLILERFYYFLSEQAASPLGYLIFSDLNKYSISTNSVSDYFLKTTNGKARSRLIMPEPLFARSRINVIFQAASILAYTLNWRFRTPTMHEPIRHELTELLELLNRIRHVQVWADGRKEWSFKYIADL